MKVALKEERCRTEAAAQRATAAAIKRGDEMAAQFKADLARTEAALADMKVELKEERCRTEAAVERAEEAQRRAEDAQRAAAQPQVICMPGIMGGGGMMMPGMGGGGDCFGGGGGDFGGGGDWSGRVHAPLLHSPTTTSDSHLYIYSVI